jgi:hypothetical protein
MSGISRKQTMDANHAIGMKIKYKRKPLISHRQTLPRNTSTALGLDMVVTPCLPILDVLYTLSHRFVLLFRSQK